MTDVIASDLSADARFVSGAQEFNDGHYFEAHEVWEDLWNDLVGDPKQVCQGLIQVAAGYHKLSIGNVAGARKLLDRGVRGLNTFAPGLDLSMRSFVAHVNADLEALRCGATVLATDPPCLPSSPHRS